MSWEIKIYFEKIVQWERTVIWQNNFAALRDLVSFGQLKNGKNTHGGVLLLLKLQAKTCNFAKSNTPSWVFFTFFKLCKWYEITQNISIFFYF